MNSKNDELLKRLLATFRIEADEHLNAMTSSLLALAKNADGPEEAARIIESVFRDVHSLKGAARAVNLLPIESLCQSLESVFSLMKSEQLQVSAPLLDLLHQAIDGLGMLLTIDPANEQTLPQAISALIHQLDQIASGVRPAFDQAATSTTVQETTPDIIVPHYSPAASSITSGTVRISTVKLDAVMRQVEELLTPKLAARQRTQELRDVAVMITGWKKSRTKILPMLRRIERTSVRGVTAHGSSHGRKEFLKVLEYVDNEHLFITTLEDSLLKLNKLAARDHRTLAAMSDSLLHNVKEMQLIPVASLLELMPRLVRELAREQGKEVELLVQGGEIELDRRMLEELKDPLIHLLRNAIDHGIESPAQRTAAGKPAHGSITLKVSQQDGGKIGVQVADDGTGINAERVKAAARKMGGLSETEDESIDENEALALVFRSGVSTSPIITDVSGRGLGLAIVREKVDLLAGSITIETHSGVGTIFHIILPLTLATLRGVLVRIDKRHYVVPSAGVERVARVAMQDIRTVENRQTILLDGQIVSLSTLGDVLEIQGPSIQNTLTHASVIVLTQSEARVAFLVDEILGEQEILIKPLGLQLNRVRNVAGASMLGNGQVVPVLNVSDLLKSAVMHVTSPIASVATELSKTGTKLSILVAEDSITSRSLIKNILESAGYAVTTSVDGLDAYTMLKTGTFDLVVSDVEMPRMDGFDLTARIRADKHLAELPVILVTALESREHREHGIDAGANAYIVKSSFDQSNLLETIRRLI